MNQQKLIREIFSGNAVIPIFAVLASFLFGGILIAFANEEVQEASGYFFARPMDTITAVLNSVFGAYDALFRGSIFNYQAETAQAMIKPITETLAYATPITLAGLGLAVSFRSGLFNIGAQGQIIFGAMFAAYVGLSFEAPFLIHMPMAVLAGLIGGALWGGLVGLIKATTGANEVVVTIMFNYIALLLLTYLLKTPVFQAPNQVNPISSPVAESSRLPGILGEGFRLHFGLVIMLAMVIVVWWLLYRSSIGFQFRALGFNPSAARTAGINIPLTYVLVMAVSGALAGMAGASQVLGADKQLTVGISATFGFDAITVALLGRNNPFGVLAAGLLFGGLRSGAVLMQANQGVPVDIVLVVQSTIVLFIAAPPLVRSLFRLPKPKAVQS